MKLLKIAIESIRPPHLYFHTRLKRNTHFVISVQVGIQKFEITELF